MSHLNSPMGTEPPLSPLGTKAEIMPRQPDQEQRTGLTGPENERPEALALADLYRGILEAIPQPVFWKDRDGVFLGCNSAFTAETGCGEKDIVGKTVFDLRQRENAERAHADDRRVIESGLPLIDIERWQDATAQGQKRESASKAPILDPDGNVAGVLGMFRDITAQKLAEEALAASEHRFQTAFCHSASGMALVDAADSCWLQVNQAMADMLGYEQEELLGRSVTDLTHPDDVRENLDRMERLLVGDIDTDVLEKRFLHKDGHVVWALVSAALERDAEGHPLYFIIQVQDITQWREAQDALEVSQRRLEEMVNRCNAIVWEANPETFQFTFINEWAAQLLGYPADRWTEEETFWIDHLHPDDRDEAIEFCLQSTRDLKSHRFEYRMIAADGREVWFEDLVTVVAREGKPVLLHGVMVDVTERKRIEGSAQQTKARYKAVIDTMYDALVVDDLDGHVVFCNDRFLEYFGMSRSDLEGFSFEDYIAPEYHAEARLRHERRIAGKDVPEVFEFEGIRKSGDRIWVQARTKVVEENGEIIGTQAMLLDITERKIAEDALKETEERLRILFEFAPDAYFLMDLQGQLLDGNLASEKLTGYRRSDLIGKGIAEVSFLSPADARRAVKLIAGLTEQAEIGPDIFHVNHADGQEIPVEVRGYPVRIRNRNVLLCIARDITDRVNAELELAQMHQRLVEHSRLAGMAEVASSILHNVGNVLNSINVSSSLVTEKIRKSQVGGLGKAAELLREHEDGLPEFLTENARGRQLPGYLGRLSQHLENERTEILDELDFLGQNIEHVKEIISMQQAYTLVTGVSEAVQVSKVVDDCLRMNEQGLKRHGVKVHREYSQMPQVQVEKYKVMQILVNLIQNAKYACSEAQIPNRALTLKIQNDEEQVTISVIDNGIGIEPEVARKLFTHGFSNRPGGHGFGLHSGARAAQELGGSLDFHSDGAGQGATFTLTFPFHPAEADDE